MDARINRFRIYISIFNITKENIKFELYTDIFGEFSFEVLKDALEGILNILNITDDHLEDEKTGPRVIKAYWELRSEKSSTDDYIILLMGYARSLFRDFESYLRIVFGLDEADIQLILKQYNANFVTYDLDPGNYTIEDLREAVCPLGDHERTFQIEYNDLHKKIKLILTRFGSNFGPLRFDEKSFFHTLLGFLPFWDYELTNEFNADAPGVYTSDKFILHFNTIDKIHLTCDVIDSSFQDGVRQPILISFVLDEKPGYKVFCQPETIHYKKINKSVLDTITFYSEDD